jgi:hypothetical protein
MTDFIGEAKRITCWKQGSNCLDCGIEAAIRDHVCGVFRR